MGLPEKDVIISLHPGGPFIIATSKKINAG
jgi:hypothetical protein